MKASESLLQDIRESEDYRTRAYQDETGRWTIGYGSTRGVKGGDVTTRDGAELLLRQYIEELEDIANLHITEATEQHQFDAIIAVAYNTGPKFLDPATSTFMRKFQAGKIAAATAQISRWNKITVRGRKRPSGGLADRRSREAIMFAGDE